MERIALLYPHTYLRQDLACLALALFDRLVMLQPSEKEPQAWWSRLIKLGRLKIITPPPFGEKLPWFERLVSSYEEWGQMMRWPENVSMFKAWPEAVEESVADIKAALLGRDSAQKEDPVLKARVILQLAHDLDQRLEELDQEYESLRQRASKLAEFVLGKDPTERHFPRWIVEGQEPHWDMLGLLERLRAWAVLVLLLPDLPNWVTTDQWAVVEELLDLAPEESKRLGSLPLEPLSPGDWEKGPSLDPERIEALWAGRGEEVKEGPRVEAWRIPYALKDLLAAVSVSPRPKLSPGETLLFYLARL